MDDSGLSPRQVGLLLNPIDHGWLITKSTSALGRYDGRVYEDLYNRAHRLNPLNEITFNPNYWEDEIVKGSQDTGNSVLSKL